MALRCVPATLRLLSWRWSVVSSNSVYKHGRLLLPSLTDEACLTHLEKQLYFIQKRYAKKAIVKEQKGKKLKPKIELTEEEMMQVIDVTLLQSQLQNVINKLKQQYTEHLSLHTGTGSIENIIVKINDEEYPLNQIAQISRKGLHLVVLNLTSFPEGLKPTLQAIQESGMNLSPQQDGTVIFVPLPKITREHRENLAKNAKVLLNQAKDELKAIHNKFIKEAKKQTDLSEDLVFNCQQQIKLMIQNTVEEGEKIMISKQKELLAEK
ncbi:ribosome-recycling factor, mitochondrial-like [Centruroides sculpturatus]|uniref:ribosome-recycling factor, mitochondrial-like n=1 Tax=Centruroides sculpturatus TaxID=218467 RepID=UPI000C6CE9DD|nr:ribosome-recycling factor, mitochondrial-like [Centruroides sculpturatus]